MNAANQAPFEEGLQIMDQLRRRKMTITALARKVRKSRATVSRALNRGEFPAVLEKIRRALNG